MHSIYSEVILILAPIHGRRERWDKGARLQRLVPSPALSLHPRPFTLSKSSPAHLTNPPFAQKNLDSLLTI
jgi:hypothetical protein